MQDTFKTQIPLFVALPPNLRAIGPLWPLSCMRFEAKHSDFKRNAQVIRNPKNICYSLALMNQLVLNERFITARGFEKRLSAGPSIQMRLSDFDKYDEFKNDIDINLHSVTYTNPSWVEIDGTKFMTDMVIKSNQLEIFSIIKYLLINGDAVMFLVRLVETIFDEHFHAHNIIKYSSWEIISYDNLIKGKPKDVYAGANVNNYILC